MSNELRDIAIALERIQRDIRSIAETLHDQKSESPVFDRMVLDVIRKYEEGKGDE